MISARACARAHTLSHIWDPKPNELRTKWHAQPNMYRSIEVELCYINATTWFTRRENLHLTKNQQSLSQNDGVHWNPKANRMFTMLILSRVEMHMAKPGKQSIPTIIYSPLLYVAPLATPPPPRAVRAPPPVSLKGWSIIFSNNTIKH